MRSEESAYWDHIYDKQIEAGSFRDNIWKRQEIVRRLLKLDLVDKRILEIGTGLGTTFAAINLVLLGRFHYVGTDVSKKFCDFVEKKWQMQMFHTDITNLPPEDKQIDIVVALDSLEHVHPEDRKAGYLEINRVLRTPGMVVLSLPVEQTYHPEEFDHLYYSGDVMDLMGCCRHLEVTFQEVYSVNVNGNLRKHRWIVAERS